MQDSGYSFWGPGPDVRCGVVLGCRGWGVGFGGWDLGFGVEVLGFKVRNLGFRV